MEAWPGLARPGAATLEDWGEKNVYEPIRVTTINGDRVLFAAGHRQAVPFRARVVEAIRRHSRSIADAIAERPEAYPVRHEWFAECVRFDDTPNTVYVPVGANDPERHACNVIAVTTIRVPTERAAREKPNHGRRR